jgi:hypothetical protein
MCDSEHREQDYEKPHNERGECYWVREKKRVDKCGEGNVIGINGCHRTSDNDDIEWRMRGILVEGTSSVP